MLSGVTRVLALAAMAPWIDRLPLRAARAVRFAIVLLVGVVPIVLMARGAINYTDALLWLQIETVTIWAWGTLRLLAGRRRASGPWLRMSSFSVLFFPFHYGMFTVVPLLIAPLMYGRELPPVGSASTFVVVGLVSFLAYGWSMRGHVLGATPFGVLDWVQAYARMAVSYAALFIGFPLIDHESNGVDVAGDPSLGPLLGILVLALKFVVELVLFGLRERQISSEVLTRSTVR